MIIIMLAQTVVMTLLSVYMEFVMPRKFGKSEPMLFPILWIYYKIRPPTDEKIELVLHQLHFATPRPVSIHATVSMHVY